MILRVSPMAQSTASSTVATPVGKTRAIDKASDRSVFSVTGNSNIGQCAGLEHTGRRGTTRHESRRLSAMKIPLSPLRFLQRAAAVHPDRTAIIDGTRPFTYRA